MVRLRFPDGARRLVLAALLLCALIPLQSFAAGLVGQTVKALGDVRITREGSQISAGSGTALELGDVIKTGPGARLRIRFTDGSILTLGENTTLSIDLYALDAANHSRTVVMTVLDGIVNAAAAKSGESQFDYQIKTANGYSAVRGTKWIVAQQQALMRVFVMNGTVELGSNAPNAKPALVDAGHWGSVDAKGTISPIAVTTPQMLQPLLDATSDTGGSSGSLPPSTVPPSTLPSILPPPTITPAQPLLPTTPPAPTQYPRAFKTDKNRDSNHDKY